MSGKLGLSDESDTEPSDIETALSSFISQKDKDLIGNTKHKIKTREFFHIHRIMAILTYLFNLGYFRVSTELL